MNPAPSPSGAPVLRRPISARNTRWAARVTQALARSGVRPNQISLLSAVFGGLAGITLLGGGRSTSNGSACLLLLAAALSMQLRLLCNLFDGMVAIEGGFKTKSGEVYNELPDRFSDVCIFVAAGYATPTCPYALELGWTAALLAVLTAYVRAFGGASGTSQFFCGPMAKQQRMAVMTVTCVITGGLRLFGSTFPLLSWALALVICGCLVTLVRRTRLIVAQLESK